MAEFLGGTGKTSLSMAVRVKLLRCILRDEPSLSIKQLSSDELDAWISYETGFAADTRLSTICTTFGELCERCRLENMLPVDVRRTWK